MSFIETIKQRAKQNIKTIVFPTSLTTIGEADIFPTSIENITISEGNTSFFVENDCLYNIDKTNLIMCFTKDSTVQIADTTESIGDYAFYRAMNLEEVNFPDAVTNIENQIFSANHTKLKNVNIGANASYISPMFKLNNYYGTVTIDSSNNYYTIDNNVLYNKDKTRLIAVLYEINGEFIVNSNVTGIGVNAFHYQNNMTSIKLPEGLIEISDSFQYCNRININIYTQ